MISLQHLSGPAKLWLAAAAHGGDTPENQDGYPELVAQALNGTAKLDFFPTGVHWLLDIPATHVLTTPAATATIPA